MSDYGNRDAINDSCLVIDRHARAVQTAAETIKAMPADYEPICLDALDIAEQSLGRAMIAIHKAKRELAAKPLIAAE